VFERTGQRHAVDEREVERSGSELRELLGGRSLPQRDRHPRTLAAQPAQRCRKHTRRQCGADEADGDVADFPVFQAAGITNQRVRPLDHFTCRPDEPAPCVRDPDPPTLTEEQLDPEQVLELADLAAERRLRDVQLRRRLADVFRRGDREEVAQQAQLDRAAGAGWGGGQFRPQRAQLLSYVVLDATTDVGDSSGMANRLEQLLSSRFAVAIVIAIAMALAVTSIRIGALTDDHAFHAMLHAPNGRAPAAYDLFRFVPGDLAGNQLRIRYGHLPWWTAPDLKIHFLRPLTSLVFAAEDTAFGGAPLAGHVLSLLFLLALLLLAASGFRRRLPPAAATLALAVFGWSAAHVEAYAWISARHALIAATFAAAALSVRSSRHRRWLCPLFVALGLSASEAALAVVPLWVAAELGERGPRRARLLACVPVVAIGAAYLVVYAALGLGTRGSGGYHDPAADPLGFLALALVRVPLLLGDAALGIPAELAHVVPEWGLALAGLGAVGIVTLGATSGAAQSEPDSAPSLQELAWLAAGGVTATVLGAAGYPAGRMLLIPDLAFAPILGVVMWRAFVARGSARLVATLLAAVHLGLAPLAVLHTIHKLVGRARATERIAARAAELSPPSGRLFLLAASDPMVFLYPRAILADEHPGAVRCWSVLSAARARHRFTRTGAQRFVLEPIERPLLDRSFDRLFRAPDRPFVVGDTVEQCGATIRVTAVERGLPSRLEVEVERALDDPNGGWVVWRDHRLERFVPPPIGESVELPWSSGPSGVL
jgi:hypothetical protein